ncbi:MAG TPA: proton-conducting membrane transporter, partial [Ramlibacter sp.]|nr:proton-conducting membrane transporter [Ramlibacter sp.]
LSRIGGISAALALGIAALWWLRSRLGGPQSSQHVTWGCGYTAPNTRMQYTGSSFSWDFSQRFRGVMVLLRRQHAPQGFFPKDAYLISDCVDAVERRLFSVINHGDESATDLSRRLKEDDPRLAFAAALAAIVLIAGLVVLSAGPLR